MTIRITKRLAPSMATVCALLLTSSGAVAADLSPATASTTVAAVVPSPAPSTSKLVEGTEIHLHLADKLSSATSVEGDTFQVISDDAITLPNGMVIPAGYSGKGEVTNVEKAGMLGKGGQLSIRVNYLRLGDTRIRLRSSKSSVGKSGVTNMVVTTVLLGPLGLIVRGHSIVYPKGQLLTAYVDEDTMVATPVALPPALD
jgi:hypothetical protein